MSRYSYLLLLIILSVISLQGLTAQKIPERFLRITDSVLESGSPSFTELHEVFEPYGSDTLLMNSLIVESKNEDFWQGMAYGQNQLGRHHSKLLQFEEAYSHHSQALNALPETGNFEFKVYTMNLLGSTALRLNNVKDALEYHQEVILRYEVEPEPSSLMIIETGKAYQGLGNLHKALRQWNLAIDYYKNSLEYFERQNYLEGMAINNQYIAESLEAQGELDESLEYYERSVGNNELLNSEKISLVNAIGIAHVRVHQTRLEEARLLVEPYIRNISDIDDLELLAMLYNQYGWTLMHLRAYDSAEKYLLKGLEISEQYGLTQVVNEANNWLHDLWKEVGDFEKSLMYYEAAMRARFRLTNRRNYRFVYEAITRMEQEKWDARAQMMARENEIIELQLRRNRTTLLIGALFLVIFSLVLYLIYRQNQLHHSKKIMSLEQSRLRSQMNPHFLFNALNSIKHYIINEDSRNAITYLNKFSKLIRKILEGSTMKEITLEEELETVKLYMNIENIRFDEQINFSIEVDPEVNPASVKIPSLILQPFLENSLWHGLSSKEGLKNILLKITREKTGYLTITIRDNGIGRDASKQIKERKTLEQRSLGIPITKERLAYFSRVYQNTYDLVIEDLYRQDGSSDGTQVVLSIPTT